MESDKDFLSCLEKGILTNQGNEKSQKYDQQPILQLAISAISLDSKNTSLMRLFNLNYRGKTLDSKSINDNNTQIVYIMRLLSSNNIDKDVQLWNNVVAVNANKSNFELEPNGVIKLKFNDSIPIFQKENSDDYFLTRQTNFMLEIAFAIMTNFNDKPKIIGITSTKIKPIELYGKRLTLTIYTSDLKKQGFAFATVALKGVKWREMSDAEIVDYALKDTTQVPTYKSKILSNPILQHFDYLSKCIENLESEARFIDLPNSSKSEVKKSKTLDDFDNESIKFTLDLYNNSPLENYNSTQNMLLSYDSNRFKNTFESNVLTPKILTTERDNETPSNLMKDLLESYDKLKDNSEAKVYMDNIALKNYSYLMDELVETSKNPVGSTFKKSYTNPSFVELNGINSLLDLKQTQRKILSKRVENLLTVNNCKTTSNYTQIINDNWVDNVNQLIKNAGERLNIYFNDPQLVSYPVM